MKLVQLNKKKERKKNRNKIDDCKADYKKVILCLIYLRNFATSKIKLL